MSLPKKFSTLLIALTASLVALAVQAEEQQQEAIDPAEHKQEAGPVKITDDVEKCFGVARSGENDCSSSYNLHSCAGHGQRDADPGEWILVPKGLCKRLAGGAPTEPQDE